MVEPIIVLQHRGLVTKFRSICTPYTVHHAVHCTPHTVHHTVHRTVYTVYRTVHRTPYVHAVRQSAKKTPFNHVYVPIQPITTVLLFVLYAPIVVHTVVQHGMVPVHAAKNRWGGVTPRPLLRVHGRDIIPLL